MFKFEAKPSELGKCYKKTQDGYYRLYKTDGGFAIYLVSASTAVFGGYLSDPENFDYGVSELEQEARELRAELGF